MEKIVIEGGAKLKGEVSASGAKNSVLPLLFSSLLASGEHVFHNVPKLRDVDSAFLLLESLGCECHRDGNTVRIKSSEPKECLAHYDIVRKMRASILVLGPLLSRYGNAKVSLPGGCAIGTRPINLHVEAVEELGARVEIKQGYVVAHAKKLKGAQVLFDPVTVGGTENLLMAASLAEGTTQIENAAKEPEINDLIDYLRKMGADITGDGSRILTIKGVNELKPAEHTVVPDRIEAGTLLLAGAITGGHVVVKNCIPEHFESLLVKLNEAGFEIQKGDDHVEIMATNEWKAVDVDTLPYPGFATDLQAQFMALMTVSSGTSVITESIFENRFMHVQELMRMNADITPRIKVAIVRGNPGSLQGAPVMATDLRASASLVLAGLAAKGETTVNRIYHLDRGYENLSEKLNLLGAKIKRSS